MCTASKASVTPNKPPEVVIFTHDWKNGLINSAEWLGSYLFDDPSTLKPWLCGPLEVSKSRLESTCAKFYWLDIYCKDPHPSRLHSCHIKAQRASQLGGIKTAHRCTVGHFIHSFGGCASYSTTCTAWFLPLSSLHLYSLSGFYNFLPLFPSYPPTVERRIKFPRMPSTTHIIHLYTVHVCVCVDLVCVNIPISPTQSLHSPLF